MNQKYNEYSILIIYCLGGRDPKAGRAGRDPSGRGGREPSWRGGRDPWATLLPGAREPLTLRLNLTKKNLKL